MGYSKYGNRKVVIGNLTFDSQREADRYCNLRLLERAGEISDLKTQVKYKLLEAKRKRDGSMEKGVNYYADFVYTDNRTGETVVEDAKGAKTKEYILKRKMMLHMHGIEIVEV